jgi:hypothetical protein
VAAAVVAVGDAGMVEAGGGGDGGRWPLTPPLPSQLNPAPSTSSLSPHPPPLGSSLLSASVSPPSRALHLLPSPPLRPLRSSVACRAHRPRLEPLIAAPRAAHPRQHWLLL